MIISIDATKAFDKMQHLFCDRNTQYLKNRGEFPPLLKDVYEKSIANTILNSESLEKMSIQVKAN